MSQSTQELYSPSTVNFAVNSQPSNQIENTSSTPAEIKDDARFSERAFRLTSQTKGKWFVGGRDPNDARRCWCFCTGCNKTIAKVLISTLDYGTSTGCKECCRKVPRQEGMVTEAEATAFLGMASYQGVAALKDRGILKEQMLEGVSKGRKIRQYDRNEVETLKPFLATAKKLIKEGCVEAEDGHLWTLEQKADGAFVRSDFGGITTKIYSLAKGAEEIGQPISRLKKAVTDKTIPVYYVYGNSGVGGCVQPVCLAEDLEMFKAKNEPSSTSLSIDRNRWMGTRALAKLVVATTPSMIYEVCEQAKEWARMFDEKGKRLLPIKVEKNVERTGRVITEFEPDLDDNQNRVARSSKAIVRLIPEVTFYDGPKFKELWRKGITDLVYIAKALVPLNGDAKAVQEVKDALRKKGAGETRIRRVIREAGINVVYGKIGGPHLYVRKSNDPRATQRINRGEAILFLNGLFAAKNRPLLASEVRLLWEKNGEKFGWGAIHWAVVHTLKCKKFVVKEIGKGRDGFQGRFWRLPEQPQLPVDAARKVIAEYLIEQAEFERKASAEVAKVDRPGTVPPVAEPEAGTALADASAAGTGPTAPNRPAQTAADATPNRKKPRGRPKGWRNPNTETRKQQMLDGWDRKEYGDNKALAGRKNGFDKSDSTRIINDHESAKRRK